MLDPLTMQSGRYRLTCDVQNLFGMVLLFGVLAHCRGGTGGAVIKFIADAHIGGHRGFATPTDRPGINSRCAMASNLLAQVSEGMTHEDTTVILGDLFDTDKPSPQVLTAVMHTVNASKGEYLVLVGNHDGSTPRPGDNALGPLSEAGHLVVESPRVLVYRGTALVLLPFNPEPPSEWVPAALAALRPDIEYHSGIHHLIIGSHFGLSDSDTPDFLSHGALPVDTAFALCSEYNACAWLAAVALRVLRAPRPLPAGRVG